MDSSRGLGKAAGSNGDALEARAIAEAQWGDPDGIHFLYARYVDRVVSVARSIVQSQHDAEDVAQDVFAKLRVTIRGYEVRDVPFTAWILRVARNAALDHVRARRQIPVEVVEVPDTEDQHAELDRTVAIREALETLPAEQREVLVLRHFVGLTPPEIAARMSRSESSVHGLHHRGRKALQLNLRRLAAEPVTAGSHNGS